ncbi:MAG: hypothetical protein V9H25_06490 [Candidatus Competibacter sp.]
MIRKTKIEININAYVSMYGSKPRGYGNWWFSNSANDDHYVFVGTYENGLKIAKKVANEKGWDVVKVHP